jgi:hypothetical protein
VRPFLFFLFFLFLFLFSTWARGELHCWRNGGTGTGTVGRTIETRFVHTAFASCRVTVHSQRRTGSQVESMHSLSLFLHLLFSSLSLSLHDLPIACLLHPIVPVICDVQLQVQVCQKHRNVRSLHRRSS